jgi:hypothetical protein
MARAIGGALSLALTILVLRLTLPEVANVLIEIVLKVLLFINNCLDLATSQPLQ